MQQGAPAPGTTAAPRGRWRRQEGGTCSRRARGSRRRPRLLDRDQRSVRSSAVSGSYPRLTSSAHRTPLASGDRASVFVEIAPAPRASFTRATTPARSVGRYDRTAPGPAARARPAALRRHAPAPAAGPSRAAAGPPVPPDGTSLAVPLPRTSAGTRPFTDTRLSHPRDGSTGGTTSTSIAPAGSPIRGT